MYICKVYLQIIPSFFTGTLQVSNKMPSKAPKCKGPWPFLVSGQFAFQKKLERIAENPKGQMLLTVAMRLLYGPQYVKPKNFEMLIQA